MRLIGTILGLLLLVGLVAYAVLGDLATADRRIVVWLAVAVAAFCIAWENERLTALGRLLAKNDLRGQTGTACRTFQPTNSGRIKGTVLINGETWSAFSEDQSAPANGERIEVVGREGLTLLVRTKG